MEDPAAHADPDDEALDRAAGTGTPRWVKLFGIVTVLVVVAFVVLQLAGVGGRHGPGRHAPVGETGERTPASGATDTGRTGPSVGVTHP